MQDPASLRIGCVKYLNARPLVRGWAGQVEFDHPSLLCQRLAAGELEVALVSSFEFLRNPIYTIVDGIAIASDGPVYSVVLAHRGDLSRINEIALDPAAVTSVALLRCLLAQRGLNPRLVARGELEKRAQREALGSAGCQPAVAGSLPAAPSGTPRAAKSTRTSRQAAETDRPAAGARQTSSFMDAAQLLIGDQAIHFRQKHGEGLEYWDLGEQWKKRFDLSFVYALWLIRPEVSDAKAIADRLRALRDENLANLDALIATEKDFDQDFCAVYYRDYLRFHFGEKEKKGLRLFQELCAKHDLLPGREIEFRLV